ncbi:NAD-dependent histone deacetylase sir2, partial [Coemansia sp. RSA 2049]
MADEKEFISQSDNGVRIAEIIAPENDGLAGMRHRGAAEPNTMTSVADGGRNSDSATSLSKRRKESIIFHDEPNATRVGEGGNNLKRHRVEVDYVEEAVQVSAVDEATRRMTVVEERAIEGRVLDSADGVRGTDAVRDNGSGSEDEDDEDLNVDGSYAPSPLNTTEIDMQAPPYTRFTPEEKEVIRNEAHTLGLCAFIEHYIMERQVSVRALLEVFVDAPVLELPIPDIQLLPLLRHQLVRFFRNRPKLPYVNTVDDVVGLLMKSKRIMVLTGAGVSVSCGIPDFRSPTGIYTRLNEEFGLDDPQQMFDIECFREMPELFYSFAKDLYPGNFQPAPTHAFVKLLEDNGQLLRNYTQNIDTLEHVQGIKNVLNCHGSFATATCIKCGYKCDGKELEKDVMAGQIAYCPECAAAQTRKTGIVASDTGTAALLGDPFSSKGGKDVYTYNGSSDDEADDDDYGAIRGIMKPDITFFGEKLPDQFDEALTADREKVDLLLVMGSSLKVAPVSDIMGNLPHTVPQIVINKTPILHFNFDVQLLGNADDIVAYLARRCGWELHHQRIPGGCTASEEFARTAAGLGPVDSPPSITFPIRVPVDKPDEDSAPADSMAPAAASVGGPYMKVVEKTYLAPPHWHPFPSAVITGKDLFVANGDSKVRLAVSSSDEEDGDFDSDDGGRSENSSSSDADDDDDNGTGVSKDSEDEAEEVHQLLDNPDKEDGSEELVRDIEKASLRNRKLSEEEMKEAGEASQHNQQTNETEQYIPEGVSPKLSSRAEEDLVVVVAERESKAVAEPLLDKDSSDRNNGSDNDDDEDDDEHMDNEDLGSVSGGFLGDFEEIEEDEDVERFISLNHTPLPSARQSPAPLSLPPKVGPSVSQLAAETMDVEENESGDESDASFESIPGISADAAAALNASDIPDAVETAELHPVETDTEAGITKDGDPSTQALALTENDSSTDATANTSKPLRCTSIERLKELQDEFRERFIPKLADGVFFNLDVYKRYTVVGASDKTLTGSIKGPLKPAETVSRTVTPVQKPSSLRINNIASTEAAAATSLPSATTAAAAEAEAAQKSDESQDGNNIPESETHESKSHGYNDSAETIGSTTVDPVRSPTSPLDKQSVSKPLSPLAIGARPKRLHVDADDDVVGTLLGVMKSPKIGGNSVNQQQQQPQAQTQLQPQAQPHQKQNSAILQQGIPDDILAAMMAMEGTSPLESPKPATVRPPNQQISAKEYAAKLPPGYKGPFSQLSIAEHAHFLGLVQKVRAGQLNAKDSAEYQRFKAKIDAEQQRFRTQAREKSLPLLKYIPEPVSQTAQRRLAEISSMALAHYAHRYMPVRVAAIRSSASGYVPLMYKETLLQRGKCYRVQMPNIGSAAVEGIMSTAADPWDCVQTNGRLLRKAAIPVTGDPMALKLAQLANADVAVSASSLIALLTLPQSYMRDVVIPFKVVDSQIDADGRTGADSADSTTSRTILLVDKPLMSAHASTPRKLNQMFYGVCADNKLTDKSQQLELGGGTMATAAGETTTENADSTDQISSENANYTLWEFGGLRMVVRYGVHGFSAPDNAKDKPSDATEGAWPQQQPAATTTTVTLKTKLEYHLESSTAETAIASCGNAGRFNGAYEDITESERLSWWMSSYLRGSPSEVWVSH